MMRKKTMSELNRISPGDMRADAKLPLVAVLDNVRSMHNVGSVFRSADAFALQHLYLCGFTPRPPHRDIHKTALGATETVAWSGWDITPSIIHQLKNDGYLIVAVEQCIDSISLQKFNLAESVKPIAIILGNEVDGIDDEVLSLCDLAVEIEQYGSKHSLNISVAAGIVMHSLSSLLMQLKPA